MTFGDNAVDIQQLLIKMIANSTKSSAMALRQALLALSFQFFVVPSKAIQHQNEAIQHLQASIDRSLPWDNDEALQAIAASMLLSVYEVCPLSLPFPRLEKSNYSLALSNHLMDIYMSSLLVHKYRWKMANRLFAGPYFSAAPKESSIQYIPLGILTREIPPP